ncbi:hypothetical protein DPMN_042715 [Dreissena polymorpha]|uniref:Uncharacterized protein n=1 Tax=Dreissena polymorpha TaxID=45954 RepID=A0A9D4CZ43_DREPO|nr:hypothetical protein DPMN_042715 [Dreissena polymorpha]
MVPRPSGHPQESPKLCQKVSQGHLQETLRQSATMPRPSWYLQETPRRFQTDFQTVGTPAGDSKTVSDGAKNVLAPVGDS